MRLEERRYDRALKRREQEKKGVGIDCGSKELKCCKGIPLPLRANPAAGVKAGVAEDLPGGAVIDEREILVINLVRSMMG